MKRTSSPALCLPTIVTIVLLAACSQKGSEQPALASMPPVPEIDTSVFLPVVRAQLDEALARLTELPYDPERNGRLGMMLAAYDQDVAAAALFERASHLDSSAFAWPYYLGYARYDLSDLPGAIAAMRAALAIKPEHPNARIKLAEFLLEAGEYEASRDAYRRVVKDRPGRVEGHIGLGKLANLEGEPQEALEHLTRANEIESRIGEVHFAMAEAHRKLGDADAAARELELFERYRNLRPKTRDEELLAIGALNVGDLPHLSRGMAFMSAGRVVDAALAFKEAVDINPRNVVALTSLMELHGRNRELAAARRYYRQALKVNPDNAELSGKWAAVLRDNGQRKEAIAALEKAVELDPFNGSYQALLGRMLQDSGDLAQAETWYRRAIATDTLNRDARFNLAYLLAMRQENQAAAELLRPLVGEESNPAPQLLQLMARIEAQMGRFDRALGLLTRARDALANGSNPVALERVKADIRTVQASKMQAEQ